MKIQIENEECDLRVSDEGEDILAFIIKGKKGAVVITRFKPSPSPLSFNYHAVKQQYEGQTRSDENNLKSIPVCEYIGCPCYCDGRTLDGDLNNNDIFSYLVEEYKDLE